MRKQLVVCSLAWMFHLITDRTLSQEKNANESLSSSASATAEEQQKAAGRVLLQSELKKNHENFLESKLSSEAVEREKLNSLEAIKRRYVNELRISERKSRSFGLGGAMESSNRSGIHAAIQLVDQDIEKEKKALKVGVKDSEDEQVISAWRRMPYETREAIWSSGCLSPPQRGILKTINPVQDLSQVNSFVNSIGMKVVEVPPGDVRMGGAPHSPARKFFFSNPLWIGEREVNQSEFKKIMEANPSKLTAAQFEKGNPENYSADACPVEHVTWYEALRFCVELSKLASEKAEKRYYRLPTEWEWEYACRAKTRSEFHFGAADHVKSNEANLDFTDKGWKIAGHPIPSKRFTPNTYGLFDMHGNVSEWCGDWYDPKYYEECSDTDPTGPDKGVVAQSMNLDVMIPSRPKYEAKVHRGGSFRDGVQGSAGSAVRSKAEPNTRLWISFRVVCEYDKPSEIGKAQYQAMLDYENGKARPDDDRLRKEYLAELQRKRTLLESLRNDKEAVSEKWYQLAIASKSPKDMLQDLCAAIAYQYERKGERQLRLQAFKDAGRYGELALEELKTSGKADTATRIQKITRIAELYESGEDLAKASEMINKILSVFPSSEPALTIQKRLNKK